MVRIGRAVARLRFRFRHLSRTAVAAWLDDWAWTEGRWYAASAVHLAGLLLLLLIPWKAVVAPPARPGVRLAAQRSDRAGGRGSFSPGDDPWSRRS